MENISYFILDCFIFILIYHKIILEIRILFCFFINFAQELTSKLIFYGEKSDKIG